MDVKFFHRARRHAAPAGRTALAGTAVNSAARSGTRAHPSAPLQPAHRRSLCALDTRLRAVPRGGHPAQMGRLEVEAFLGWLASERSVSASTHRQALSALIFLYAKVLQIDLPWLSDVGRPRVQRRLPVVLTKEEVARIFAALTGEHLLFAQWLYGTGMRIAEGLQLRVKDIDFSHRAVIVRKGKGGKDRVLMLPQSLEPGLRAQRARVGGGHAIRPMRQVVWKCPTHWPANTT